MSALMMAAWLFAAAEIFMTGSQPLSPSLCNRGYLSIHLRPLLQKLCRWHQRKRKATHTPAAGAWHKWCEENIQEKMNVFSFWWGGLFWTLRMSIQGNKTSHYDNNTLMSKKRNFTGILRRNRSRSTKIHHLAPLAQTIQSKNWHNFSCFV